jgi:hypothetical protein
MIGSTKNHLQVRPLADFRSLYLALCAARESSRQSSATGSSTRNRLSSKARPKKRYQVLRLLGKNLPSATSVAPRHRLMISVPVKQDIA